MKYKDMDLRDYYAGIIMTALVNKQPLESFKEKSCYGSCGKTLARMSFHLADYLIEAREYAGY